MAVGRDRDQRRCQLLSRLPAPLPPLPGTLHQSRPPGLSGGMSGILSAHLLSALLVLTPVRWKPYRLPRPRESTFLCWGWAVRWTTRGNERKIKANWPMGWASAMADCWEWVILDRAALILPAQQRSYRLFLSLMKPKPISSCQRFWCGAYPGEQLITNDIQERSRRIQDKKLWTVTSLP